MKISFSFVHSDSPHAFHLQSASASSAAATNPSHFTGKKPSSLNRRNLSSTTHWHPAYHCGFFHFLPTSAFPIASLFHFKFYLYDDVIHNELERRKSWCNSSNLLSKNSCKRGCHTTLILYSNKPKRDIHNRFFMISSNCLASGIKQVITQSAYLMSSIMYLEQNAFVGGFIAPGMVQSSYQGQHRWTCDVRSTKNTRKVPLRFMVLNNNKIECK